MSISPAEAMSIGPFLVGASAVFTIGWVATQWLRMRHGYPIENSWGKPMLPAGGGETLERVKLLSQENAQLRAELGSVKDRLSVLERIATDRKLDLDAQIENLRDLPSTKIN
jgi:hypothetical protein